MWSFIGKAEGKREIERTELDRVADLNCFGPASGQFVQLG